MALLCNQDRGHHAGRSGANDSDIAQPVIPLTLSIIAAKISRIRVPEAPGFTFAPCSANARNKKERLLHLRPSGSKAVR